MFQAITRRCFAFLLAGGAVERVFATQQPLEIDRLRSLAPPETFGLQRAYRADAVITLLSVPIFRRSQVGSGFLQFNVAEDARQKFTQLTFGAGSLPDRTGGLNKLGFIQEAVVERSGAPAEAAYFGFITASPEENLKDAKESLGKAAKSTPYMAIDATSSCARTRTAVSHFLFPSTYHWAHHDQLIGAARGNMHGTGTEHKGRSLAPRSTMPATILHGILGVLRRRGKDPQFSYVYNEKHYTMKTEWSADTVQCAKFQKNNLIPMDGTVSRIRGEILAHASKRKTQFQLWIHDQAEVPMPLRIEMQPKSFLKLAFEQDASIRPTS